MARIMGWNLKEATKMAEVASTRELGFCLGNAIDLTVFTKIVKAIKEQNIIKE